MAGGKLDKFEDGSLAKGVNLNRPDFSSAIELTDQTLNVTSGIFDGIGPRFGCSPIPGHNDSETPASANLPGLVKSETTVLGGGARQKIFGIVPLRFGGANSAINTIGTYYAFIVSYLNTNPGGVLLNDALILSVGQSAGGGGFGTQSTNIYDGLASSAYVGVSSLIQEFINGPDSFPSGNNIIYLLGSGTFNFLSFAAISISGNSVPQNWMISSPRTNGDATHVPVVEYDQRSPLFGNQNMVYGSPPEYYTQTWTPQARTVLFYCLTVNGAQNIDYSVTFTPSTTTLSPSAYISDAVDLSARLDASAVTATKLTAGVGYANNKFVLVYDPQNRCASSYQCIFLASSKPTAIIIHDWLRSGNNGLLNQYYDLVNAKVVPQPIISTYSETAQLVGSSFNQWPNFVRGTPMVALAATGTQLGAANSGVLRANTVYEFSYSHYFKRLNLESNVGPAVKIQTGATDFVGLQLYGVADTVATTANGGNSILPFSGWPAFAGVAITQPFALNHLEYRFYYRPEGFQEWLPALTIDAAKYWFYPYNNPLMACTGGIGGTPGGRAAGFNDYSQLQPDNYNCVVPFKNRVFWLSSKSLVFSMQNNPFAYPLRNSSTCPTGSFKGALVHAYYGQAQQDARLVIFSTKGTFVGKFTGDPLRTVVQVSTAASGDFPLDGSDFVLNPWTSVTAFSYRAAVVAEGILYFWGPDGAFRDDGVNPIKRISIPLEPSIFGLYDASQTDNIHCTYNQTTKEVYFFYPPATADSANPTHILVWNHVKETWLYSSYSGQIDSAQQLKIDTGIPVSGNRTVIFSRASSSSTIQRAYFFDQRNLAGDMRPTTEMLVKTVSTPSTGVRRFTVTAGSNDLTTINVGDLICLQQNSAYANGALTNPADFIATVAAVNSGAKTIDVTLPSGVTFDTSASITTANHQQYFPIWHAAGTSGVLSGVGLNGFSYKIDTKFWIPAGMGYWAYWLYLHTLWKLNQLLPITNALTVSLGYSTPISSGTQTDTITLSNNSANNYQSLHPLVPGNQNFEGQGIKMTFSGIQLGSSWMIQYLEAYAQMKDGLQLKIFEG